ncbi:MAG: RNA 2'-phosphotransferase [Thermoprotei archaeon]|nr:MAG: RNA 2'-phosphotransferase [Thermoprotei archaeon]RLF00936.1 MAG: RNA 2'-phosphotransferase [Thermoprotei archaeon]
MDKKLKNIYKCSVCGVFTEDSFHCGRPCKLILDSERRLRLSKLLSAILRHIPDSVGIKLDSEGFVKIPALVRAIKERWPRRELYSWLHEEHVRAVAELCPKQRFEIKGDKIRARYGHSIKVDIRLVEDNNVTVLYHGTSREVLSRILKEGLKPMKRLKVHMTTSIEDALINARRKRGTSVVLIIDADKLRRKGYRIFKASRTVYLADYVPPDCIVNVIKVENLKKFDKSESRRK